jgi:hypothetical protein
MFTQSFQNGRSFIFGYLRLDPCPLPKDMHRRAIALFVKSEVTQ